jgi:hypothetical protein
MNRGLAWALVRLYPRGWLERYGAEFAALLEEGPGGVGAVLDVMGAALGERIFPTQGDSMETRESRLEIWSARAPWAVFGAAPVVLLAVSYSIAFFLLWSGWRMFLPAERMPFVPVTGWAIAYFGIGRLLYFWAPMLVGFAIAWMGSRARVKALWPVAGMLLIAWVGSAAQVRVSRPTLNEPGHVGMFLAMGHVGYAPYVLAVSMLVYLLLRLRRGRTQTA